VLAVLVGPGSVAAGRTGVVAVSADGVHWSSGFAAPLFDPQARWVPGERRTASFFVRNGGPSAATLRLQVRAVADELVQTHDLRFAARTDGGSWMPLPQDPDSAILRVGPLPAGEHSHVDVQATFASGSTNQSQSRSSELWFVVRLSDARTDSRGGLPDTGAPVVAPLVLVAAALIATGTGLVRRRRAAPRG
jgi:hypothetical protein